MDEELELLRARADELSARGLLTDARFLNLKEQYFLAQYLSKTGRKARTFFFGGYPEAEREMLFLLPDYLCDMTDGMSDAEREATVMSVLQDELSGTISPLRVTGSGYHALVHRDYMGAVLGLGIERFVIGDIVCDGDFAAVLFAEHRIALYLCDALESVGADKVKTSDYVLPAGFGRGREYKKVEDTVASERLDCVVAALLSRSRESAKDLILSGGAEQNYTLCKKPDVSVMAGDIITLHGTGKFRILALSDRTKKGRLRLMAEQYL